MGVTRMANRFCTAPDLSLRAKEDNKEDMTVYGYALKWNEIIDFGWMEETIEKGAFPEKVRKETKMLIGHQHTIPLANTKSGTLRIKEDKKGLYFEADLSKNSQRALEVLNAIERGDLTDVSVCFFMTGGKHRVEKEEEINDDGKVQRTRRLVIERVGLLREISFVDMGQYATAKIQGSRQESDSGVSYRGVISDTDEIAVLMKDHILEESIRKEEERINNRLKKILKEAI